MRYRVVIGTVIGLVLLPSLSSAESSPRSQLEEFFRGATAILSDATDAKQARDDVRDLAQALFDGRGAARRALGPEWHQRTVAEREEFARMFTGVLEHAYLEIVRAWLPRDRPPTVRILDEDVARGGVAIIRTEVQARDGSDVRLDYVMTNVDEAWLVHDVVIDGVSLVENYRAQFARILRTSSYADLTARLQAVAPTGVREPIAASPSAGSRPGVVVARFDAGRADLSSVARRDLEGVVAWLAVNEQARVRVEGHSDQRGDLRLNQALAERRANAIREHLVTRGIDSDRVAIVTYGASRPVCEDLLETCWRQNRRAVVRLTP
jgi:outer membrane protein OmpA-like peptidoglycan-associated protein